MKIDENLIRQAVEKSGQPQTGSGQAKGTNSATGGDAFAKLLLSEVESAVESGGQESAVSGVGSLGGIWSTQALVQNSGQASSSSEAISSLSSVLDGLDSLQNALQGSTSPKDINSLIEQINEQAAGLDDKMTGLPADSKLKDLAEEAKVTAYMESMKFKRGDYL